MFKKFKRKRNQDGTFKKDVGWTPWNEAWEYKMSEELNGLVVAPLISVDANTVQLAALAGGGAALAVVKTYAKKQISK
jgi:hypothetical protein